MGTAGSYLTLGILALGLGVLFLAVWPWFGEALNQPQIRPGPVPEVVTGVATESERVPRIQDAAAIERAPVSADAEVEALRRPADDGTKVEPAEAAADPVTCVPVSVAERRLFRDTILADHAQQVISGCSNDIRDKWRKRLRSTLSDAERPVAAQLIESLVSYDLAYRVALFDALADFVISAPDLSAPKPGKGTGVGGNITHGTTAESRAAWGGATQVRVSYFVEYDRYPRVAEHLAKRREVERLLKPFVEM